MTQTHLSILGITPGELSRWLKERGHPSFVSQQIYKWIYQKRSSSFEEMSNLSKSLRKELEEQFSLETPTVVIAQHDPADETRKILLELPDGSRIESVIMPRFQNVNTRFDTGEIEGIEEEPMNAYTACLSTQVGCQFACRFCASGQVGYDRNLSAAEIVSQLLTFLREGHPVTRIVFMGMGEPLHNMDELKRAVEILTAKDGLGWSPRRITVSTVGLVPEIYRLGLEDWKTKLAISLHATTDEKRAELLPIARSYQIDQLKDALLYYQSHQGRRISFEYLMIEGFNDSLQDADRLIKICERLVCHVNLIPYNAVPRVPFRPSAPDRIQRFRRHLVKHKVDVTVRYSRGRNIDAACGQLRLRHAS